MSTQNVRSLDYFLVPGKPDAEYRYQSLHDRTYVFWRDFWAGVFQSLGISDKPNRDDFSRQDMFSVMLDGNDVVALHAYTFFDIRYLAHREHSYFSHYFSEKGIAALQRRQAYRVMTMEYFAVAKKWRSKEMGLSLATVIAGLGVQLAQSVDVDAILGVARTDNGVDKIGKAFGAEPVGDVVSIHDVPSEPVAFFRDKIHEHRDAEINRLVGYFWSRRVDTRREIPAIKIAA